MLLRQPTDPALSCSAASQVYKGQFVLLAALTALFVGVGYMLGGPTGMAMALAFALVGNLISYWNADKIVLSMYKAQEVPPNHPCPLYTFDAAYE